MSSPNAGQHAADIRFHDGQAGADHDEVVSSDDIVEQACEVTCPTGTVALPAFCAARTSGVVWRGGLATEVDTDDQGRCYVSAPDPLDGQRCDVGNGMYDTREQAVAVAIAYITAEIDDAVAEHFSRFGVEIADPVIWSGELWEVFAVNPDGMVDIGDFTATDRCERVPTNELWPASPLVTRAQHTEAEELGLLHETGYRYRNHDGLTIDRLDEDDLDQGEAPWYVTPAYEADDRERHLPTDGFGTFADALLAARTHLDGHRPA